MTGLPGVDDFREGDVLTAEALNGLVTALMQVDAVLPAVDAGGALGGRRNRERLKCKPWLCRLLGGSIVVEPGPVMLHNGFDDQYWPETVWVSFEQGANVLDAAAVDEAFVWLHVDYDLAVVERDVDAVNNAELAVVYPQELSWCLELAKTPGEHTRSWPLAFFCAADEQPLTQLRWGVLCACEVTGICDEAGEVMMPRQAVSDLWGDAAECVLARAGLSNAAGDVLDAELRGWLDETGALELFLGPYDYDDDDGGAGDMEDSAVEPDEWEGEDPDGGWSPWVPGEGGEPAQDVFVPNGYVAGAGIASCVLMKNDRRQWAWRVALNTGAVASALGGLSSEAQVTYTAGGSQEGVYATVRMGLGDCSLSGGASVSGSAGLVFEGTVGDASKTTDTKTAQVTVNPQWQPEAQVWTIPASQVATGSAYIKVEPAGDEDGAGVRALRWYRISVDTARLKRDALSVMRQAMAARSLSGSDSSSSADSTVDAVLGGTLAAMTVDLTLS